MIFCLRNEIHFTVNVPRWKWRYGCLVGKCEIHFTVIVPRLKCRYGCLVGNVKFTLPCDCTEMEMEIWMPCGKCEIHFTVNAPRWKWRYGCFVGNVLSAVGMK